MFPPFFSVLFGLSLWTSPLFILFFLYMVARLLSKNPLNLLCNIARGWKMRFLIRYRFR